MIYIWIYLAIGILIAGYIIYLNYKAGYDYLVNDLVYSLATIFIWIILVPSEIIRSKAFKKFWNKKLF